MSRLKTDAIRNVNASVDGITLDTSGNVAIPNELQLADKIVHTGDTNTFIRFPAADTVSVETAGSERLRVHSNGNVTIGSASFDTGNFGSVQGLNVYGTQPLILVNATGNGTSFFMGKTSNTCYLGTSDAQNINFRVSDVDKMILDSSGRLLVGTTTEGHANADDLTIATTDHTGITLRSATNRNGSVFFSDGTSGADEYRGWIQYTHTNDYLTFGADGSEKLRIDSGGDVLIGLTSSPSGNGTNLWVSDGTVARLGIEKTGSGACKTTIGAGSNRAFNVYNETADHEIIKAETNGDVQIVTGNLVIGTAGKGIDFSVQNASSTGSVSSGDEVLDHYEHGTFTPNILVNYSTSGVTQPSTRNGTYTRIGSRIFFGLHITGSFSYSGSNHNVIIGNLPFTANGNSSHLSSLHLWSYAGISDGEHLIARIKTGNSSAYIQRTNPGASVLVNQCNTTNWNFMMGGSYTI